jgi:hypothetical protein
LQRETDVRVRSVELREKEWDLAARVREPALADAREQINRLMKELALTNYSNLTIGFGPHLRDSNPLDQWPLTRVVIASSHGRMIVSTEQTRKIHFDNAATVAGGCV